jgi:hypothetical protein
MKQHFCKDNYDYHKYCGKSRASLQSFYKRRDRYWFEKLSRQKPDREILDFFVANFVSCDDPERMWIGEIIKNGETNYVSWRKRVQSLAYTFKEESESIFDSKNFDKMFAIERGRHPPILKEYLQSNISLETFMILNSILDFSSVYDKRLDDPVWNLVSRRMKKYKPFLNIDVQRYTHILKEFVLGGK